MGDPDRFAPDAETPEARDSASRVTLPAPSPTSFAEDGSAQEAASGIRAVSGVASVEDAELERFGSLSRIPRLAVPLDALRETQLDATAGVFPSLGDGQTSFEHLLDICAMPPLQAVRIFGALRFLGIIEFEEPARP